MVLLRFIGPLTDLEELCGVLFFQKLVNFLFIGSEKFLDVTVFHFFEDFKKDLLVLLFFSSICDLKSDGQFFENNFI